MESKMPNPEIERVVDDLISKGRIAKDLRNEYIQHFESGLGDQLLRSADYTKKTQMLADDRRKAEEWFQSERGKVQEDRRKLDEWFSQAKAELAEADRLKSDLPNYVAKIAAYEQLLKDYNMGDQIINSPTPTHTARSPHSTTAATFTAPTNTSSQQQFGSFITREDFDKAAANVLLLQSKMARVQARHQKLFGEPLEDDLIGHFMQTGQDPEEYWKVKYAVDTRLEEMSRAQQEARDAKIREDARNDLLRELAVDPARITGAPFGMPKSNLPTPLEHFAASRAAQYGQNQPGGTMAPPNANDFVPPEKKPELQAARDRIDRASSFFLRNFDATGQPISEEGRRLYNKHLAASS